MIVQLRKPALQHLWKLSITVHLVDTEQFGQFENTQTPRHFVNIRKVYTLKRYNLGIPYDPATHIRSTSRIKAYHYPQEDGSMNVDIGTDIAGSEVFISLGGNDIGLMQNLNPYRICNNLAKIAKFYKEKGARKVYYIIPYSPTPEMAYHYKLGYLTLKSFHWAMKFVIKIVIYGSAFDGAIDLSDFDNNHRTSQHCIPEPTKMGAKLIAKRIYQRLQNAAELAYR